VNNKLSCKRGLGALNDGSGDVIVSDADHTNLLNNYLCSVCTTDNGIMPAIKRSVPDSVELNFIEFTPDKVCAAIKKLNAGGSSGPDIAVLFKRMKYCIAGPLSLIFNININICSIKLK